MDYRALTDQEITILESRGCTAEDWQSVRVAPDFTVGQEFRRVQFSGTVELGMANGFVRSPDGSSLPAGVRDANLRDVTIGNNCCVRNTTISSTTIGDGVFIENVDRITRMGDAPFANGLAANILTEDGGRSVPLWRYLTAQTAHLLCHFKHHPIARALEMLIQNDADSLRLERCIISPGARIRRTGPLRNVWIGEAAWVEGAARLENCYIDSTRETPVRIGEGVAADETIFLPASKTSGGVRLERCLVGEGVELTTGFAGKHTLFFANSQFGLGEADAVMAGPFATSLHKSTLVLTCQCSFATFGSGANSSNHHFKLGPRHGGVLRRGVKCGSGSYVFWPCDIGAYTTIVGRHAGHMDTALFPFSLLLAEPDKSVLIPGVNLFTSGSYRDERKWRERDNRKNIAEPRDLVNPSVLSPYVLQAMETGCDLLRRCIGVDADVRHGGVVIPASRIEPAMKLYERAIIFAIGETLFARASQAIGGGNPGVDDLVEQVEVYLNKGAESVAGRWRDWNGMLLPGAAASAVLADIENNVFASAEALRERLLVIHQSYDEYAWLWLAHRYATLYGQPDEKTMSRFVADWRKAVVFRHNCFAKDAGKEFTPEARIGFGIEEDANISFRRIRGKLANHPLVVEAEAEKERLLALTDRIPAP